MKKLLLTAIATLVVLGLAQRASAQVTGFGEFQSVINNGVAANQINLSVTGKTPVGDISWFSWSVVSKKWSETYLGFTYSPMNWLSVQAGYGLETANSSGRFGGSIWAGKGTNSVLFVYEEGGSGPWHKLVVNHKFTDWLGIGLMDQGGRGTGLRAELRHKKLVLWGAVLWKDGVPTTFLTVHYNF